MAEENEEDKYPYLGWRACTGVDAEHQATTSASLTSHLDESSRGIKIDEVLEFATTNFMVTLARLNRPDVCRNHLFPSVNLNFHLVRFSKAARKSLRF